MTEIINGTEQMRTHVEKTLDRGHNILMILRTKSAIKSQVDPLSAQYRVFSDTLKTNVNQPHMMWQAGDAFWEALHNWETAVVRLQQSVNMPENVIQFPVRKNIPKKRT